MIAAKGIYNNSKIYGTGVLVGPNYVLTCAHNICGGDKKRDYRDITFSLLVNGTYIKHKVISYRMPP